MATESFSWRRKTSGVLFQSRGGAWVEPPTFRTLAGEPSQMIEFDPRRVPTVNDINHVLGYGACRPQTLYLKL